MELKNKRVLLTGADGFIGSHLAERLLAEGCKVRAFVYYNSFNSWGWLDTLPKETRDKFEIFELDDTFLTQCDHQSSNRGKFQMLWKVEAGP